jgi:hypothetical protein
VCGIHCRCEVTLQAVDTLWRDPCSFSYGLKLVVYDKIVTIYSVWLNICSSYMLGNAPVGTHQFLLHVFCTVFEVVTQNLNHL